MGFQRFEVEKTKERWLYDAGQPIPESWTYHSEESALDCDRSSRGTLETVPLMVRPVSICYQKSIH